MAYKNYKKFRGGYKSPGRVGMRKTMPKVSNFVRSVAGSKAVRNMASKHPTVANAIKLAQNPFVNAMITGAIDYAKREISKDGSRVTTKVVGSLGNLVSKTMNSFAPSIITSSGDVTFSSITIGKPVSVPELIKNMGQKVQLTRLTSARYGVGAGNQLPIFNTACGLNDYVDRLRPQLTFLQYASTTSYDYMKSFIHNHKTTYRLANSTIGSIVVDILTIVPKYTSRATSATSLEVSPIEAWNTGMIYWQDNHLTTGYTSRTSSTLGARPWDSEIFNAWFTCKNVQRVQLKPGSSHEHVSTLEANYFMHDALVAGVGDGNLYNHGCVAGLTVYTMFIVSGTPAYDDTNLVTVGDASISVVRDEQINCYTIQKPMTQTSLLNELPVTGPLAAVQVQTPTETVVENA